MRRGAMVERMGPVRPGSASTSTTTTATTTPSQARSHARPNLAHPSTAMADAHGGTCCPAHDEVGDDGGDHKTCVDDGDDGKVVRAFKVVLDGVRVLTCGFEQRRAPDDVRGEPRQQRADLDPRVAERKVVVRECHVEAKHDERQRVATNHGKDAKLRAACRREAEEAPGHGHATAVATATTRISTARRHRVEDGTLERQQADGEDEEGAHGERCAHGVRAVHEAVQVAIEAEAWNVRA